MVQLNYFSILVGAMISFGMVSLVTGNWQSGILAGLVVGVGGAKWVRVKKHESNDEIEYDERVISNIKKSTWQTFSYSNLLLFCYLLISELLLNQHYIKANHLILYLTITYFLAFFIVPSIVKKN
ncbi:hypothetical protein ACWM35_14190 [Neobacillus sp. K501]